MHVFESAIDLLSYATIIKRDGGDWKKESMMSLAGVYAGKADGSSKVPAALEKLLSENRNICRIVLHFDRDKAGRTAANAVAKALQDKVTVVDDPPSFGKDLNEYLCMRVRQDRRKERGR